MLLRERNIVTVHLGPNIQTQEFPINTSSIRLERGIFNSLINDLGKEIFTIYALACSSPAIILKPFDSSMQLRVVTYYTFSKYTSLNGA